MIPAGVGDTEMEIAGGEKFAFSENLVTAAEDCTPKVRIVSHSSVSVRTTPKSRKVVAPKCAAVSTSKKAVQPPSAKMSVVRSAAKTPAVRSVKSAKPSASDYGSTAAKSAMAAEIALQNQAVKRQKLDGGKARQMGGFMIINVKGRALLHKSKLGPAGDTDLFTYAGRNYPGVAPYVSTAEMVKNFQKRTREIDLSRNGSLFHVLAKSSKMIPVMLMGTIIYGIKYTIPEYICTFLVAGGVSAFALSKTSSKIISKLAHPNAPLGYGLCFLNLAFDGFTNSTQDSIKMRYPETCAWDIMLGMKLWGTIYNIVYMFCWPRGGGFEAVRFCQEHPEAAWDILMYCLCWAVGQNFIFLTISHFGSLANTTITTTRKFMSIVVSSLLSGNLLSTKQWGSMFMVFSGLLYQIFLKWRRKS